MHPTFNSPFQFRWILNLEGILLEVNQSALNFAGVQSQDVLSRPFWETYWWNFSNEAQEQLKQSFVRAVQGEFICYQVKILGNHQQIATLDFSLSSIKDTSGKIVIIIADGREISELKETSELEKVQAQILEYIHDAVICTDPDGNIESWNKGAEKLYGYTSAEILGKNVSLLYFPEDLDKVGLLVFQPLLTQESHEVELRNRHKSGREIYVDLRLSVMKDQKGEIIGIIGCSNDITIRKQVNIELKERKLFLERITAASPNIIYLYDIQEQRTIYANQDIYLILGYTPEEGQRMGKDFLINFIHPEDYLRIQEYQTRFDQQLDTDIIDIEYRMRDSNGYWQWFYSRDTIFSRDSNGKVKCIVGSAQNITDIKLSESKLQKTNEQLNISNAELARATRLKDEFLANMSHELRTPLNAILGLTEALQEEIYGQINRDQQQALETIDKSGTHLLSLINDILDLAKIEAGQAELKCVPTNISKLCESSIIFIKHQALLKRLQLKVKIPPNLSNILLDERRIRQVLINLLSNAVKFTPEGGSISLQVTTGKFSGQNNQSSILKIAVIDTGIGISSENINKLFQSFVQVDGALNREYNGTGLGLALVKRIVEMHGGTVSVNSKLGIGSCFMIYLPYNKY